MVTKPESYQSQLVKLSNFMYRNSGYYKGIVNYYVNMALCRWNVDTEVFHQDFYSLNTDEIKAKYFEFISTVSKFNLENEFPKIFKRVFLEDTCYGYLVENEINTFIYYLPSDKCKIKRQYDGIYGYGINASSFSERQLLNLPKELQSLISAAKQKNETWAIVPPDKSICIKYNDNFSYVFPPLFTLINSIADIKDYKALAKRKSENENYNLLAYEIPIKNDQVDVPLVSDDMITPFIVMGREIIPEGFGIIPSPVPIKPIQFQSNNAERDKVRDSISQMYSEAAVPEAMMGASTSGSELKQAIENDSGEIYRIYRQIEQFVNLKMMILGFTFKSYRLCYQLLNITTYNQKDFVEQELKDAQASIPNKFKLCSSKGISPTKLLGNTYIENTIFNIGDDWTVLKSSYTSSNDNESGRTQLKDDELSKSGEQSRQDETNDKDNRI